MFKKNIVTATGSIVLTIVCGTILTIITANKSTLLMSFGSAFLLAILLYSQLKLARYHSQQVIRTERYHQLGRKLVHINRIKRRDETVALKVLNHIVNQPDSRADHAKIWQRPMEDFSGDLAIACISDSGNTYTLIADLTGHGIAAAMGATPVATIFQATAKRGLSVEQIIIELNDKLTQLLPPGFFCCAAVAVYDGKQITVCNAGLPEILIANNEGYIVDRIESTQLPLGIEELDTSDLCLFKKAYTSPHQLYAFTDGLIETRGANDSVFDSTMLESVIESKPGPVSRIPAIQQSFDDFVKGSEQSDDISIVEVNIC